MVSVKAQIHSQATEILLLRRLVPRNPEFISVLSHKKDLRQIFLQQDKDPPRVFTPNALTGFSQKTHYFTPPTRSKWKAEQNCDENITKI